jgi:hypothetical protein
MKPWLRTYFAAVAARELESREQHYPAMIDAGEIARDDAEADLAAWRVLVPLLRDGSVETELSLAQLELATARALRRCEDYVAEKPGNAIRIARRDAIWGIHERIRHQRETVETINAARIRPAEDA